MESESSTFGNVPEVELRDSFPHNKKETRLTTSFFSYAVHYTDFGWLLEVQD
jgi:hypothetical protein